MVIDYILLKTSRPYRTKFDQSKLWSATKDMLLSDESLCRTCKKKNRIRLAKVVDHIIDITVEFRIMLFKDSFKNRFLPRFLK